MMAIIVLIDGTALSLSLSLSLARFRFRLCFCYCWWAYKFHFKQDILLLVLLSVAQRMTHDACTQNSCKLNHAKFVIKTIQLRIIKKTRR